MSDAVPPSPAQIYDQRFVPALFGPWAEEVCQRAGIEEGQRVLDVACGTGVLAMAALGRVGTAGRVVGLDLNPEMLAVARPKSSEVEWVEGRAEDLPFDSGSFDRVVSQFGFMFFEDHARALREMARVLVPGGRLVVAMCDGLDHSPGYAVLTELLHRLFGSEVAEAFRAPFALGDRDRLRTIVEEAQLPAEILRIDGRVRFDSIQDLVSTERACVWTLGGLLDDAQFARLQSAAEESLRPFLDADGRVDFGMPCLCIVADRPA